MGHKNNLARLIKADSVALSQMTYLTGSQHSMNSGDSSERVKGSALLRMILPVILLLFSNAATIIAQTTFTANANGNWTTLAWVKTGPSLASYPGQPGYEAEIHDVVINGAGITVTLNSNIISSVRNVALTSGRLDISSSILTMTGDLSGGGILNFNAGTLYIAGNNTSTGIFNPGTGTVYYNGATQNVRGTTYFNLSVSGTNSKTIGGNTTVSNNLTVYSGQFSATSRILTVNGLTTIFSGGSFTPGAPPGTVNFANVILSGGSIVSTSGTAPDVTISGNLLVNNSSVSTINKIKLTVAGTTQVQAGSALTLNGANGSGTFGGVVIINGNWNNSANNDCYFHNGLTFNGISFSSGNGTYTFDTNSQTISGSSSLAFDGNVNIGTGGIVVSNSTTITIKGVLSAVNNTTWRNNAGSVLNYENSAMPMGLNATRILDASAVPNLVNYSGSVNQSVKNTTYHNLNLSGTGIKTLAGATTVNGNLAITGTASLLTNQYQLTGNATGTFTMTAGTGMLLGNPVVATNVSFPGNFISANVFLNPGSTVSYQANISQTISAVPVYGNLITATSGIKTLSNNTTIAGNLTIGTNTTLDASAANYGINLAGSWINNGAFNERQGNVTFNGTGPQSVSNTATGTETFYNLTLNTTGPLTSAMDLTASNSLTMTNGVVLMPGKVFFLGTGAANPGTLIYSSGWVTGTFSRWAVPALNGIDLLFPIGTNTFGRIMTVNFASISTSGALSVNFIGTPPPTSGLPLIEDIFTLTRLFPEGYWNLVKDGSFSFTGTYNLSLVPSGFTTYTIDGNTRIVSKFTASDWFLNGTHVPGSPAKLFRNSMTSFPNNYAVAFAELCNPVLINCPGDIVVNNLAGTCSNTVTWIPPVINAPCPGYSVISNYNPGDNFNVGPTQVVYYLVNGTTKYDSCKFNVLVKDVEPPLVICKNINLYIGPAGSATLNGTDIDNGSTDNCALLLIPDKTSFACSDVGSTIPVILTGTDPSGNSATCSAQVTVLDTLRPTINTKPATVMLDASGNGTLLASDVDNGTFDNCTPVTLSVTPGTFTCASQGQQTVLFRAQDSYGNIATASVQVSVKSSLTINSTTLSSCDAGGLFARYNSDVSGGDGNYTYSWDGLDDSVDPFVTITGIFPFIIFSNTSTDRTPFFNNLMPDGTYTIRLVVTDGNTCRDTMDMVINKSGLVFNNVTVRYSGACEGSTVTYSVNPDVNATYNWGVTNGTILTSPLDTNKIDVLWNIGVTQGVVVATSIKTDLLGETCESSVVDTVAINIPPSPQFDNPLIDVCSNSVIIYELTQLYLNYTWSVTGGTIVSGGTGSSFVAVRWGAGPSGKVTVSVASGAGCSSAIFIDINIFNLTGSVTAVTNVTCNGAGDGKVTVAATPGTGVAPYEYSLDGAPYQVSGSFTNIIPGIHDVTIRDAMMCTFDVNFIITQAPVLTATVTKVDVLCFGGSTGSITAAGSGGAPPYLYSIDGGVYQVSGTFNGLAAGIHSLNVKDANLCVFNQNINISQPAAPLTGAITTQSDVSCSGGNDGSVTVSGSGGTPLYQYSIDGGPYQASGNFTGLPAGSHTVTVKDFNSCTSIVPVTITQPPVLVGSVSSQTNVSCFGGSDGQVTIVAGGGTPLYQYSLNGGAYQASSTFMGLSAGPYTVTVRDAKLCTTDVPVTITEPVLLVVTVTSNSPVCEGTPLILTGGPVGMASYSWTGPNGFTSLLQSPTVSNNATLLMAGVYTLTVTSPTGCIASNNTNVIITPLNTITLTSGAGTDNQTLCINTALTNITYGTTGASGATISGLPAGVTGSWAANVVIISGTPTVSGTFNFTVTLTGGCGIIAANGTIRVTPDNTITLSSAAGTDNQTVCINTAIAGITYTTTGATGATVTGLPAGVTGSWAAGVVTINGTPTVSGTYNYSVNLSGGCGTISANGTITSNPISTIILTSAAGTDDQTLCINTPVTNITYGTTSVTGATVTGLPAGVTGNWAGNVVTISGSPSISGTFNYTVNLIGGCGSAIATGILKITPANTITLTSAAGTDNQTVCIGVPITPITYVTTGATGASFTGLPLGMSVGWAANTVVISGAPTTLGTYTYTINLSGGCGTVSATGTIAVVPVSTITLTSGAGTNNQTLCINTPVAGITYATTQATGATVTGLPAGVTGTWAANVVTISGTPTVSGTFNYTVNLTGGCGGVTATGTIIVKPANTIALTSAAGTDNQIVCINNALTNILYGTTGATGATITGLPAGVTGTWAADVITISGTSAVPGTYNYTINLSGGCGTVTASGTIRINPDNTIALTSAAGTDNQTVCINTSIINITYGTTGSTGATVTGLPAGVTGSWAANVVTISGTPTASGTFNYTVTPTGGCGSATATGILTVTPDNTIALTSAAGTVNQTVCINTSIINITYGTTGATGATVTGLPAGVTGIWAANVVTISGTPTVSGTFNYTVNLTGGCGGVIANGTIIVNPDNIIALTSAAGTDNQQVCINNPMINITYGTTGATGSTVTGLPAGVTGSWAADVVTISGTPIVSGTFNYTVNLTGGCGTPTASGSIIVNPDNTIALTSAGGTDNQTTCINTSITNITYGTTGATGATVTGLPAGVTGIWAANVITIGGTSTVSGSFNYTVNLTGGCGTVTASGAITVNPGNTIALTSAAGTNNQTVCINTVITDVTYGTTGATGATVTGLPAGVTGTWAADVVTISGTPTVSGTFNYSVNLTGGCGSPATSGTIVVKQMPLLVITNPAGVCSPATADITSVSVTAGSTPGLALTYWTDLLATVPYATPASATAGTYYIKGTEIAGCYDIKPVVVTVNGLPSGTLVATDVLCFGNSTGSIDLTVTGGTLPYVFLWSDGSVNEDLANVLAGTYSVTITDANLCNKTVSATINEPASALSGSIISQNNVTLFGGNDGSVSVTGSGGTPPYLYKIDPGLYQVSGTFNTLTAELYTVTVQDANLCTFDLPVLITQPAGPLSGTITSQTNVLCFGGNDGNVTVSGVEGIPPYEYSLNGGTFQASGTFSSLTAGLYTVTVRDALVNTFDVPVNITEPAAALSVTTTQTDVLCAGNASGGSTATAAGGTAPYNYSWNTTPAQTTSTATGLTAGTYTVTVTDGNGCSAIANVTILEPAALTVTTAQVNVLCKDGNTGSAAAVPAGGIAPYTYSWNTSPVQTTDTIAGLIAGSYTVTVTDANLCTAAGSVTITEPAALSINLSSTQARCPDTNEGTLTIVVTGGTAPYNYIWSDGITIPNRTNVFPGTYSVVVYDANGCGVSGNEDVTFIGEFGCLQIPTVITPNGDGKNDEWIIRNIDIYPNAEVLIYTRWGKLIYRTKNLSANPWDGKFKGKLMPTDSYHFILYLNDGSGPRSGVISIIR